ncbi:MAG: hypothetical protein NT091_01245 [Candidatus Falkowbacteria bacterium]|nr:hypothetical protein [Candidatus Falkowbacteria bacterium]
MKFSIKSSLIKTPIRDFLRHAGYAYIYDQEFNKESFVKRLTRDYYPRLHLYVKEQNGLLTFDLHLDQKKASYAGTSMHNAEYNGKIVEDEIYNLKVFISNHVHKETSQVEKIEGVKESFLTKLLRRFK